MSPTVFLRRFDRGLPQAVGLTLLALAAVAVFNYAVSDSKAAVMQSDMPPALSIAADAEVARLPRECDLMAGIDTECLFLD